MGIGDGARSPIQIGDRDRDWARWTPRIQQTGDTKRGQPPRRGPTGTPARRLVCQMRMSRVTCWQGQGDMGGCFARGSRPASPTRIWARLATVPNDAACVTAHAAHSQSQSRRCCTMAPDRRQGHCGTVTCLSGIGRWRGSGRGSTPTGRLIILGHHRGLRALPLSGGIEAGHGLTWPARSDPGREVIGRTLEGHPASGERPFAGSTGWWDCPSTLGTRSRSMPPASPRRDPSQGATASFRNGAFSSPRCRCRAKT
jgi:hypothetical protein